LSPVNRFFRRVDEVKSSEDTTTVIAIGQKAGASSGSESTACSKRGEVNVGGPGRPLGKKVSVNKGKAEDIETTVGKSEGAYYR
jgi:hypothetical protein